MIKLKAGILVSASLGVVCLQTFPADGADPQIQALKSKILQLESRIEALEAKVGTGSESAASVSTHSAPRQAPTPSRTSSLRSPVDVDLITKKLHRSDGENMLGLLLQLKNIGGKDLNSIEGDLIARNADTGDELEFAVTIVKFIAAGDSATWYGGPPYEPGSKEHQAILNGRKSDVRITLRPQEIIYTDGSKEVAQTD